MRLLKSQSRLAASIQTVRAAALGLDDRGWVLLLGGLALAIRLPLIVASGDVSHAGDTAEYLARADDLANGEFNSDYRLPGYPLFILVVGILPGSREAGVVVVQHLIGIGVVLALVHYGSRWLGRPAGVAAAVLSAVTPIMLGLEHTLQPDFLFGACALVGTGLIVAALARIGPNTRLLVAAGIAFAVAAYVKPVGIAAVGGVALAVLVCTRSFRQAALRGAVVGLTMAVLILPWMVRNDVAYGHFAFSTQGGQTLFKRVFDIDHRQVPISTREGRLVARLQVEQRHRDPRSELNHYVSETLQRRGYSGDEAVALERRVAVEAIRHDPVGYLADTAGRVSKFLTDLNSFDYGDVTGGENSSGFNPDDRSAPVALAIKAWFGLAKVLSATWWILSLHVLAGLLLLASPDRRTRAAAGTLASVWLSIAVATALSHGGLRRYSAQMAPEAWLLGAAGAVLVATAVLHAVREMRRSAPEA